MAIEDLLLKQEVSPFAVFVEKNWKVSKMFISPKDMRKVYLATYQELKQSKLESINADTLHMLIRKNARKLHIKMDKARTMYVVGFFMRSKIIVPDGMILRVRKENNVILWRTANTEILNTLYTVEVVENSTYTIQ